MAAREIDDPVVPDEVAVFVGPRPERLAGYGSCSVWRGAGLVAKIGPGAAREAHVLSGRVGAVPLRTPELVAEGDGWVVMRDVGTDDRPWDERALMGLLGDLAALHDCFAGADATIAGPLPLGGRPLIEHHATYGVRERVALPAALAELLDDPEPLLAILEAEPATLVHGDAYPGNVVRTARSHRVWIDWEDALIGPAAIDLAAFCGSGPWILGRSLDRDRVLATYHAKRRHAVASLERSFDAAVIVWTVSQNLDALRDERGSSAFEAFIQERVDALRRLKL